ncbi:MAG: MarR family transcriptional regulator [Dehalococcoidales bacterium]|nr:MarR family transcriptional regulator [Dehalococcoidales bacterium]
MTRILQDKATSTKLQILIEIAAGQPDVQQKDIAKKLGITPQWVSEYIIKFVEEGLVTSEGRSKYRVTAEGIDWVMRLLRELREYFAAAEKVISNIAVSAAVADQDLSRGQQVGLVMREGILIASPYSGQPARGIAVIDARTGEDIGVSNIEGIIELEQGKVTILKVPGIQRGGSRRVDLARLRKEISGETIIGSVGTEAMIALRQIGSVPTYTYGAKGAIMDAAQKGVSSVVVCVDDEVPELLQALEEKQLGYKLLELEKP